MRYLGLLSEQSPLHHVKESLIVEILGRSLKNILFNQLSSHIISCSEDPALLSHLRENKLFFRQLANNCDQLAESECNDVLVDADDKYKYDKTVAGSMHGYILHCIVDFMNLAFGNSPESKEFWKSILLPHAARHFGFSNDSKINLNALLFSFIYHTGIEMDFTKKPTELGKIEKPFTNQVRDIHSKSKCYRLRNIPYCVFANKYKEYLQNGQKELAMKALKIKMAISKYLDNSVDITGIAEIANILLEEDMTDKALENANNNIKYVNPYHTEILKLYTVLIQGYYDKGMYATGDKFWSKAEKAVTFHWGPYHPLHATLYSVLAFLQILHKNNLDLAQQLYQACLICSVRSLGTNHLFTAEVYRDFGRLYLRMNNKELALANIEKAYLIYESSTERCLIPLADSAFQLACIMEDQRRFKNFSAAFLN